MRVRPGLLPWSQALSPVSKTNTGAQKWLVRRVKNSAGGVEPIPGARKFVIDFAGGVLAGLEPDTSTKMEPVVSVTGAELTGALIEKLPEGGVWRMVIEVKAAEGAVVELAAHIAGFGRKLTENWLYQWVQA